LVWLAAKDARWLGHGTIFLQLSSDQQTITDWQE
jgi:hypothetical protein